jgi:branched-chain amino acid transport system substrate-binding protein
MEQSVRRKTLIGSVLLIMGLLLAACGGAAPAPPSGGGGSGGGGQASAEPIKVGAVFDLTGATADVGKPYSQGVIAFVEWKNAQGGVQGRKLDLIHADYEYKVPKSEELYTKYVTQDKVVAFSGWGTGDTEALKTKISQDKIPFISASYSAELADPSKTPYNFLVGVTYSDQLVIAQKWALEDWKAKGNSGAPKFAYLHNDSPFGKSPLADGKKQAEANGVAAPLEVPSPRGATDLTPQLTQIKDYGANYVFLQNTGAPAALALKGAKSLGLTPAMQFVCLNWCANETFIKLAGDAAEGTVGAIPFVPVGAEGAKTALDYAASKNIDYGGAASNFVQGWWSMAILTEGIDRAVKSGKPVTGEAIKAELEALKDFSTGGVTQPVSFSGTDHRGSKELKIFQVKSGKWEPVTEFMSAN